MLKLFFTALASSTFTAWANHKTSNGSSDLEEHAAAIRIAADPSRPPAEQGRPRRAATCLRLVRPLRRHAVEYGINHLERRQPGVVADSVSKGQVSPVR